MKQLFLFLFFGAITYGQVNFPVSKYESSEGSVGIYVSDSLWTDGWIDTSATPDDTLAERISKKIILDFDYDWAIIELIDTGTTYDDSLIVEMGVVEVAGSNVGVDTSWHNISLRDTTWSVVNGTLVDDNSRHIYSTYYPLGSAIRIRITNVQTVLSRVHYFNINFIKKEKEN